MVYVGHSNQKSIEPVRAAGLELGFDLAAQAHAQEPLHLLGRPRLASCRLADHSWRAGSFDRSTIYAGDSYPGMLRGGQLVWEAVRRQRDRQPPRLRHARRYGGPSLAAPPLFAPAEHPAD